MAQYLVKRVVQALGVVFAIAAITFFVLNVVPGDPVRVMMGDQAKEEAVQQVRHELGLDRPVAEQFLSWLAGVVRGDLGTSYTQRRSVAELIGAALGYTVRLATGALLLAMALGLVTGVLAAAFHNRWVDRVLMTLAVAGISAPAFWMAVVLQLVFALGLRWFPLSGVTKPLAFVLPTVALGVRQAASIARVTRTSLLDVLGQDYMTTAVAKGASRARVVLGHGLKNALVPIITIVGTQFGDVFAGSVLVETIFGIPGVGSLLLTAVNQRDLPLIEGGVMYVAAMFVPPLLPYAPDVQELSQRLAAPSSAHLLGTDELGRDILTRLVYGCRVSLSVGLASQAMALVCGFVLGACAGYVGGRVDAVVSFVIQVFSSFPFLLFSLVVMYALGPGLAIIATVMAFNLFGDALRDALDPRLR